MKQENISQKKLVFFVLPLKFFISHRLPIARKAQQDGYEVHIISIASKEREIIEKQGFIFHDLNIKRKSTNPINEIRAIFHSYKLYRNIKPTIVHHITIKPVLYGTFAARLAGVKAIVNAFSGLGYVFTASGFKAAVLRNMIKLCYRLILRHPNLRTIIQNQDDMRYLISKSIIRKDQSVLIRGSGVDLDEFIPTPEPIGVPIVVLPARLLKDKGVIEFVEAAKTLEMNKVIVRMVLVGDIDSGNPSSITQNQIDEWVAEGIVEHWSFSSDMPETLSNANIVCLPSYREGLPKSLIEACAAGRAIITTDVPGCREVIDLEFKNGLMVPVKNSTAIADAIADLIENKEMRTKMAANGRRFAEKEFSVNNVVNKTLEIYKELSP